MAQNSTHSTTLQNGCQTPDYIHSNVHGQILIHVSAVGYNNPLKAKSWLPGSQCGSDSTVASISLDGKGSRIFNIHADRYPHRPQTTDHITGKRISNSYVDTCYLQAL